MAKINLGRVVGEAGTNGTNGTNGLNATINGENVLNIVGGNNVTVSQVGDTMTLNAVVETITGTLPSTLENNKEYISTTGVDITIETATGSGIIDLTVESDITFTIPTTDGWLVEFDGTILGGTRAVIMYYNGSWTIGIRGV